MCAVNFLKRLGVILAATFGVVIVAALALDQFNGLGFSNLLFWAALVVLGIGVVPALAELGSGLSALRRSPASRDKSLQAVLAESRGQRDKSLDNSLLFGLAGILIFVLSFAVGILFAAR